MDVGTHALASVALCRIALPRAPLRAYVLVILAGTAADLDFLSVLSSPSAYLHWHRTYTHSFPGAMVLALFLTLFLALLPTKLANSVSFVSLVFTACLAGITHLALDACQSDGITLLWPFSPRRIAADWVATIDPWIIAVLIAAVALPELLHLVSDEIGAKDRRPRGRVAALIGLSIVLLYVGARAILHSQALAALLDRSYRSEVPRNVGAFPESVSPLTWHAIVETDHLYDELTLDSLSLSFLDPEAGVIQYKPEPSPALDKARNTRAAMEFLAVARFPKASVEKILNGGNKVQLRDLRYAVTGAARHELSVVVTLSSNDDVLREDLIWARDLGNR